MSVGLITGLLFAAISINMRRVECIHKTAEAATSILDNMLSAYNTSFWKAVAIFMNMKTGIYKDTKFCGNEYVSIYDNATDFGTSEQTDRCCKKQGKCKIYVRPGVMQSGIKNNSNFTIWGCNCTDKFKACLDDVATSESASDADKRTALDFGWLFFTLFSTQCMEMVNLNRTCGMISSNGRSCDYWYTPITWKLVEGPTFNLQ